VRDDNEAFCDPRLGVYCCGHLFRRERGALLVARTDDGCWEFLCGDLHDFESEGQLYHVSVGVLLEFDATLQEVAHLPVNWEAERVTVGSPWLRTLSRREGAAS
jgi:hypothetical protein